MIALVPSDASPATHYLCVTLFGGTVVPVYSIVMAYVNDAVGKNEFVAASGCLLLMNGVGAAVGPVIAGIAMLKLAEWAPLHNHRRAGHHRDVGTVSHHARAAARTQRYVPGRAVCPGRDHVCIGPFGSKLAQYPADLAGLRS
jgi:hypothetical protein